MLIHTTIYSETHKDLWSLIKNQWLKPLNPKTFFYPLVCLEVNETYEVKPKKC